MSNDTAQSVVYFCPWCGDNVAAHEWDAHIFALHGAAKLCVTPVESVVAPRKTEDAHAP